MTCLFVAGSYDMMYTWREFDTWNLINAVTCRRIPMHVVDLPA